MCNQMHFASKLTFLSQIHVFLFFLLHVLLFFFFFFFFYDMQQNATAAGIRPGSRSC